MHKRSELAQFQGFAFVFVWHGTIKRTLPNFGTGLPQVAGFIYISWIFLQIGLEKGASHVNTVRRQLSRPKDGRRVKLQ